MLSSMVSPMALIIIPNEYTSLAGLGGFRVKTSETM
jgi:hypothetical protein